MTGDRVETDTPCPDCGGPITLGPADPAGIVVPFYCPDPACPAGKHEERDA